MTRYTPGGWMIEIITLTGVSRRRGVVNHPAPEASGAQFAVTQNGRLCGYARTVAELKQRYGVPVTQLEEMIQNAENARSR